VLTVAVVVVEVIYQPLQLEAAAEVVVMAPEVMRQQMQQVQQEHPQEQYLTMEVWERLVRLQL
jgi:hypothetical protein